MEFDPNIDQEFDSSTLSDDAGMGVENMEEAVPALDDLAFFSSEAAPLNEPGAGNAERGFPEMVNDIEAEVTVPENGSTEANPDTIDAEKSVSDSLTPLFSQDKEAKADADIDEEVSSLLNSEDIPELSDGLESIPSTPPKKKKKKKKKKRERAVKKGRPRRRKGEGLFGIPNILVTCVWVALTLMISVTLGRLAWVCAAEVLAFGREDKTVSITVYENDSIDDITTKLAREGLIHYPGLFKLYAQFAVDDGEIRPGIWDLNTKYDYHALVKMMSPSSSREVIKVMIPEGYSCRQIFSLLEENKVCTVKDISSYAANGELDDYWFLENVPRGNKYCLEGFLFPDTYEFYKNDSPKNVLTRMLNNFNNRFDEDLRWQIQTLNDHLTDLMRRNGKGQDYINSHLFNVRDVVNVAAMIERETSSVQEGYTIASVIYNRLFSWGNNPAYLGIDATIVYALDGKNDLTLEDLRVDSPYNTYTNIGLPIGPIANPGLSSLKAALAPSDTNYYFYVLDPAAGSHHFSTTQAEHDAFRATLGG